MWYIQVCTEEKGTDIVTVHYCEPALRYMLFEKQLEKNAS